MRLTSALATLPLLAVLLVTFAVAPRYAAQSPTPTQVAAPSPLTTRSAQQPPHVEPDRELSGSYRGIVTFGGAGESVPALFEIDGDRFTMTAGGLTRTGRIVPATTRGFSAVALQFDGGSGAAPRTTTITLRARKVGRRLSLEAMPGEPESFSFHTAATAGEHGGRDPASVDSNSANTTNTSVTTNTSTNTSANTPRPTPTPVFDAFEDPQPTPLIAGAHPPRDMNRAGRVPHVMARAGAAQPADVSPAPAASPAIAASPETTDGDDPIVLELKKQLHEGLLALRAPDVMRQGETQMISARISLTDIGSKLTAGMKGTGETSVENATVGRVMKVVLAADKPGAFDIIELSPAEQTIANQPFVEWKWSVTPRESGKHTLHLIGTALVTLSNRGEKASALPTIDKEIAVQVNYGYVVRSFFKNQENWKLILGGVTIPGALAGAWKFLQKRRRKGGTDAGAGEGGGSE